MDKGLVCLTGAETDAAAHRAAGLLANRGGRGGADVSERLDAMRIAARERQMREWLADIEAYPDPGDCYFASSEGMIKIGVSRHPSRRIGQLRRDHPDIELLATIAGGVGRERYYHLQFAAHRLHGEWFARCPEILAEIERLNPSPAVRVA